jgi:acyl carrier protein
MGDEMHKSIEELVLGSVHRHVRDKDAKIDLDTRLADIDVESLEFVEIVFELEEGLDIEIDYNANDREQILTVRQLCDKVAAMAKKNAPGDSGAV